MRYPLYRAYWFGTLVSVGGFQIFQFTQFLLVFHLTGSPLHHGLVGLATAVPAITLTLFGGVVADKVDRRKLLSAAQMITAARIFTLGALTLSGVVQVWHVWILAFATGAVAAFDGPARQAAYPRLLDRSALSSGVALTVDDFDVARMESKEPAPVPEVDFQWTYEWTQSWNLI